MDDKFKMKNIIDEAFIRGIYPPRKKDSHKGQNGRVLIVGGGWMYHGAPLLASLAALKAGVDLVYVAVPEPICDPIRAFSPDLIVVPLPDYKFTNGSARKLLKLAPEVETVLIGNGMGKGNSEAISLFVRLTGVERLVIDADGIDRAAVENLGDKKAILTPHEGEFRRVSGTDLTGKGLEEKMDAVKEFAAKTGVTVILKGPTDIITDGREILLNSTGNAGMTAGGTGDALAGLAAAFMSKQLEPLYAASLAAYFNGLAGDMALETYGLHFTASDMIKFYPYVMKPYDRLVE
ncbi:MAG: NAD(P)H-hydrate dehydratase [Nitrososphaerota archaeon]|nr:NAD(P)H-hydrate dehydratase [Nitrososphaerota archaeon]MDG6927359.1 NAD(P)H-hydrate dehydratase [Nitrososphaerota archaeon]MDG6930913.1 NAD(P)H-hydrate dehydratase [Nitrososphaerota archaeon]MDG6932213.1 NAD(P)H-hydrate dehydratase [Nitrososphaerota archaeon]MDG6935794.1 NAD(P)H-hydrate dehydratase [Nitrososphaerota archaeon]